MTKVRAHRDVSCPFSAVIEHAETAAKRRGDLYLTPAAPLGEQVVVATKATPDQSDPARRHDALLIAWKPRHRRLFPEFRGVLTARPHGRSTRLFLSGTYEPPLGRTGRIFDWLIGRRIARRTLENLLAELGAEIEALWDIERNKATV